MEASTSAVQESQRAIKQPVDWENERKDAQEVNPTCEFMCSTHLLNQPVHSYLLSMRMKATLRSRQEGPKELINLNKRPAAVGASLPEVVKSHLKNLKSEWRKRGEGFSSYWLSLEPKQQVSNAAGPSTIRPGFTLAGICKHLHLFGTTASGHQ